MSVVPLPLRYIQYGSLLHTRSQEQKSSMNCLHSRVRLDHIIVFLRVVLPVT